MTKNKKDLKIEFLTVAEFLFLALILNKLTLFYNTVHHNKRALICFVYKQTKGIWDTSLPWSLCCWIKEEKFKIYKIFLITCFDEGKISSLFNIRQWTFTKNKIKYRPVYDMLRSGMTPGTILLRSDNIILI